MVSYGCTDVESEDGVIITHVCERESSARFMIMAMFMAQFAVRFSVRSMVLSQTYIHAYISSSWFVFVPRFEISRNTFCAHRTPFFTYASRLRLYRFNFHTRHTFVCSVRL